jgi:hypothetical protein
MLKKVLVVAALLCVMVPFAAQDKAGKWGVEVTAWYGQALGVDTTYAYGFNTADGYTFTEQPYTLRNEYRWSPSLKLSYSTDVFTFWVDYTYYDQSKANSINTTDNNQLVINPALTNGQYLFTYCDAAEAAISTTYTNWDINVGHTFHPTDKWALMVYGGLRHINLENNVNATYVDNYGQNNWGAGATDSVRLHALMTGWGLNFGLQNDLSFGKRWAIGTGLEVSMMSTTTDYEQEEVLYSPYYGTYGITGISRSQQKVTPAVKMYAEAKFNFNDSWYGKVGYRYEWIKDGFGFDFANTPEFSGGSMYGIPTGGYFPTNKDVTFDGLYFTIGVKF